MNLLKKLCKNRQNKQNGFVMVTIITFIPLVFIFSSLTVALSTQAYRTTINQELIRQAQLASISAMDFAKEQYEIDPAYSGTPEQLLYEIDGLYEVRYEVISLGYSNPTNTQQDIQGIGKIYKIGEATPLFTREIQGKITYTSGVPSSARFIFIVDNSGSMSASEWLQSKNTVDASVNYVLSNAPTAEVAIVQYGTNNSSRQHKYDVTVPFTRDSTTATNWDREFGPASPNTNDFQDHLPGSLAQMRLDSVYGPGDILDLDGATNVQYVLFTDALGINAYACCSSLKKVSYEPSSWHNNNGSGYSIFEDYGEYDLLKNGTVYEDDGYPGLTSSWTVLSVYDDDNNISTTSATVQQTRRVSAAIASVGGNWSTGIDPNPDDPEGDGILPRKLIATTLAAGPDEIVSLLQEILEAEINI